MKKNEVKVVGGGNRDKQSERIEQEVVNSVLFMLAVCENDVGRAEDSVEYIQNGDRLRAG